MSIGEEVLTKLVEVLSNQEKAWENDASTAQVQAHQASGKAAACKLIKEAVFKLVQEIESAESEVPVAVVTVDSETKEDPISKETRERLHAHVCTHRARIESGVYKWCGNKKTKHTDYCRKHNKELGLTNAKK